MRPAAQVGAEGQGFEPWRNITAPSSFQDCRHRPLGEPSELRCPALARSEFSGVGRAWAATDLILPCSPRRPSAVSIRSCRVQVRRDSLGKAARTASGPVGFSPLGSSAGSSVGSSESS